MPNDTFNPTTIFTNRKKVGIKLTTINKIRRFKTQNGASNATATNDGLKITLYGAVDGNVDYNDMKTEFIISKYQLRELRNYLEIISRYAYDDILKIIRESGTSRITIISSPMDAPITYFFNFEEIVKFAPGAISMTLTVKDEGGQYYNFNSPVMPIIPDRKDASKDFKNLIRKAPGIRCNFLTILKLMCETTKNLHITSIGNYLNQIVEKDIDVTPDDSQKSLPKPQVQESTPAPVQQQETVAPSFNDDIPDIFNQ